MRKIYLLGLLYIGLSLVYLMRVPEPGALPDDPSATLIIPDDPPFTITITVEDPPDGKPTDAASWFQSMKAYCNPVEVDTRLTWSPAPRSMDGTAYEAACFALAGRIDSARERILQLPEDQRWNAAGVVFGVGHPVADAGDDLAAGPIMELVVEFWPNHYMALYHAGAARFESGDGPVARDYLERFLLSYETEDGWRSRATQMLAEIDEG